MEKRADEHYYITYDDYYGEPSGYYKKNDIIKLVSSTIYGYSEIVIDVDKYNKLEERAKTNANSKKKFKIISKMYRQLLKYSISDDTFDDMAINYEISLDD